VKELLKVVNIRPSYCQNKKGALFMAHSVVRKQTVGPMLNGSSVHITSSCLICERPWASKLIQVITHSLTGPL